MTRAWDMTRPNSKPWNRALGGAASVISVASAALVATVSFAAHAESYARDSISEVGNATVSVSHASESLSATSDCPNASKLAEALEPLLSETSETNETGETDDAGATAEQSFGDISVRWSRSDGEYRARIAVDDGNRGERLLASSHESCAELEEHVVAVLALLLDGDGLEPATRGPETPVERPLERPLEPEEPEPVAVTEEPPPVSEDAPFRIGVAALGGMTAGLAPDALGWLGGEIHTGKDWWQIGVTFYSTFKNSVPVSDGRIDLSWMGATLKPCVVFLGSAERFHALACPLFSVAALRADAVDYDPAEPSVTRPWYSAGGGVTLAGPLLGAIKWTADASALVPLQQERFSVQSLGEVVDLPTDGAGGVAFWLSAGLGVEIW